MSYFDGPDGEAVCAWCRASDPPEPHGCGSVAARLSAWLRRLTGHITKGPRS